METFLYSIIVGGIAGWLASIVTGTNERMGCLLNIVAGIIGGLIGGWVFQRMGWQSPGGVWVGPIVVSFVGAALLLLVVRLVTGGRRY
ncbi:MAG TPA: GlsB/YeaQ/YmgE family stress response membrane protein [Actinomycetota bacterium]|nr:GlsB/YeaQ/YmgE family stress response membrane protein [Actinomycetota bacterium]